MRSLLATVPGCAKEAHEVVAMVKERQPTVAELSKLLSISDKLERELSEIAEGLSDDLQRGAVASRCRHKPLSGVV
jgi:hypothetical protein